MTPGGQSVVYNTHLSVITATQIFVNTFVLNILCQQYCYVFQEIKDYTLGHNYFGKSVVHLFRRFIRQL